MRHDTVSDPHPSFLQIPPFLHIVLFFRTLLKTTRNPVDEVFQLSYNNEEEKE